MTRCFGLRLTSRLMRSLVLLGVLAPGLSHAAAPIDVRTTSSDARTIVEAVGGEAVAVAGLVRAGHDAHVVRPSGRMVEELSDADLLVVVGHGLERAWLPRLVAQANNERITPGSPGYLDLSETMVSIAGAGHEGGVGSFHEGDNPHYLLDPIEGIRAARAVAGRLSELAPERAKLFEQNYRAFAEQVMSALTGPELAAAFEPGDYDEIAIAIENNRFDEFLARRGVSVELAGFLAGFAKHRGAPIVGDHDYWPYFARRYGLTTLGYLEPEPGMPPTPKHLQALVAEMRDRGARLILTTGHFDPRHARFVSRETSGIIVPMAEVPGSRVGTDTYLEFVIYNATALLEALERAGDVDQSSR